MNDFWQRLKQCKLVQSALEYIAAAFALIQVIDAVAQRSGSLDQDQKLIILALAVGFLVALVISWHRPFSYFGRVLRRSGHPSKTPELSGRAGAS
ncbi:MAG: hypothetical protein ACREPS_06300 [Rhodanobacteraceae bacterium]